MSLLTIAQRVSDIIGLPEITQVVGSPADNVRQLRAVIQQGGDDLCLMTNSEGGGWSVLDRIYEFNGTAGETEYDLPADFKKLIVDTAWQKDKYWLLRGSLNSRQWQQIRNRQATVSYNVFRILRTQGAAGPVPVNGAPNVLRKFTLEPAPGETTPLVYEYISDFWWVSADGATFKKTPTVDTDESVFGDNLHILDGVWRWKNANGLNFAADLALFESSRDTSFAQDAAFQPIPLGYTRVFANKDESDVTWCP